MKHTASTLGREFRPAYQQLGILRQYHVAIATLTGTTTSQTLDAIKSTLLMTDPQIVKMPSRRDNLQYSVLKKKENKAKQQVCEIMLVNVV